MNINFSSMIKFLIPFIVIATTSYILSSALYFVLPKEGIEKVITNKLHIEYRKYNVQRIFSKVKAKIKKPIEVKKQEYQLLTNIKLKAVYAMGEEKGWIIIADNSTETFILSVGDEFKSYKLSRIYTNYVVFTKNNQEYKVSLKEEKKLQYSVVNKSTKVSKKDIKPEDDHTIIVLDDVVSVKRAYLNSYINNFDKIWKEISIREVKDANGNINGFKVNGMSNKSVFKKLGLRKGDVIKAINNIDLKSYNDAFSVYKKINKVENLHIRIIRNNTEMELDYEIK